MGQKEDMAEFMGSQVKALEEHKWIEGEKLGKDPGDSCCMEWIRNHAAEFRQWWVSNHQ